MKFRTRLFVTFITIVLIPLILTVMAFIFIGGYLNSVKEGYALQEMRLVTLSEDLKTSAAVADGLYEQLSENARDNCSCLEDLEYLDSINSGIEAGGAYLVVRKGADLYYKGNEEADRILESLPHYGQGHNTPEPGYYDKKLEKYIRQIDFVFSDGSEGSLFVVVKAKTLISRELLVDMFIAVLLILIFTSAMLTQWIHKGVFSPIKELNLAMQKIKEGNFDHRLMNNGEGEIGDLYRNYEDMRMRLKESAEEDLLRERQSRELISNISHDLKTPITAIKGYVEGIMDGVADTPEKVDKYIKTIYNKANDMDKLINELTIYSGIDNNKIPYSFHKINVADYFGDCVEEVGLDLESRHIQLHYENLVSPDTMIIADPEQMKKVVNNIISNSVKYMDKPRGEISIRILDESESVRIEIEDNGKGIAQKDLQMIFDRFYRTDASRNSAQGGSGIGLSIVKKIIEDHGGYIWATSKEGEGTCLHFVIRKYIEL